MSDGPKQATSHADLIAEIMDSRVPKNEREWAAQREIERLRKELNEEKEAAGIAANRARHAQTQHLAEIEKLRAIQEAQQRELVIRAHNQTRHLEEVQKLRAEIDALQRLVQREQAEVYRLSTVFIKPGECE